MLPNLAIILATSGKNYISLMLFGTKKSIWLLTVQLKISSGRGFSSITVVPMQRDNHMNTQIHTVIHTCIIYAVVHMRFVKTDLSHKCIRMA